MATKKTDTDNRMVLLEFQYQKFVMPIEQGMTLFSAMADMAPIEYDYTNKVWKYSTGSGSNPPTLRVFTPIEFAQLSLEDRPEPS